MLTLIFRSLYNNQNISYQQAVDHLCGCDSNNNLAINFAYISTFIDTFRSNPSDIIQYKEELISNNSSNVLLTEEIQTMDDLSAGSVIALDHKHIGIVHLTNEVVAKPMYHTKLSVFELENSNIINIIKNSYEYILELISKSNAKLIEYPRMGIEQAVDVDSYNSYRKNRLAIKAEKQSLVLAKLRMIRAMAKVGNKIVNHYPDFQIDIFNQAIFLKDISTQQAEVINQAFEYITLIT